MYEARGNQIFVTIGENDELFITIHPTNSNDVTIEDQAKMVAQLMNENWSY